MSIELSLKWQTDMGHYPDGLTLPIWCLWSLWVGEHSYEEALKHNKDLLNGPSRRIICPTGTRHLVSKRVSLEQLRMSSDFYPHWVLFRFHATSKPRLEDNHMLHERTIINTSYKIHCGEMGSIGYWSACHTRILTSTWKCSSRDICGHTVYC